MGHGRLLARSRLLVFSLWEVLRFRLWTLLRFKNVMRKQILYRHSCFADQMSLPSYPGDETLHGRLSYTHQQGDHDSCELTGPGYP